ncbi:aldehyde dehydrogenase family protein [Kribbella shirazensis]|uniref:Acyl-CoA reductase-like NAD-dependent aldehyde dehydrogenase n=1 Tax=Kribbella shirazensis TaxID=1105143 RepID=A0A7X5VHN0_9ACTN|nr:aldehyde dehydrogenase family protein [Kribbella shirazensis]NIK61377.1 acyl-CoA reductase-like NAD-dependent aldehyde dehydrogenase [Kribbella shirazensis]
MTDLTMARQYVGGRLVGSAKEGKSVSPADGSVLGTYADADEEQGAEAIIAARRAFEEGDWARDRRLRHRVLTELADAVEGHRDELVLMLARENGKILKDAAFEIGLSAPKFHYYAALALSQGGRASEVSPGLHMSSVPEPIGVAGIITPWNSPVILLVRSLAPALAAGCTAVVKLPAQTGMVNGLFHNLLSEIPSLPAGVVSSLTESGNDVARLLVSSPEVDVLSYTGSTLVGRQIMANAAPHLKRLSLELGGKTPMIVFDDADLDAAVPVLTAAITTFTGQFCMTGSRILVQRGVADELRDRMVESLSAIRVGPGDDPESQMGPMIDAANALRVDRIVEEAGQQGTVLVRGGQRMPGSAYYHPSLIAVDDPDLDIVQREVFGPVATFETFGSEDDAIRLANCTEYGLAASIWTRDADRPRRVGRRLHTGTVWTNTWAVVVDEYEEGGFKQSGIGRLNGIRALEEFQEFKTYAQFTG